MQQELAQEQSSVSIQLLGCNTVGQEDSNPVMCEGRTLPWLQDTADDAVWTLWDVTYRDVVILDGENHKITAYNLTQHDLSEPANYDSLKALLLEAAR